MYHFALDGISRRKSANNNKKWTHTSDTCVKECMDGTCTDTKINVNIDAHIILNISIIQKKSLHVDKVELV